MLAVAARGQQLFAARLFSSVTFTTERPSIVESASGSRSDQVTRHVRDLGNPNDASRKRIAVAQESIAGMA